MERWSVLALAVAAAMIAGPAFAQSTGGAPQTQQAPSQPDAMKSDGMKSDTMKPDSSKASRAGRTGNREQVKAAQEALKQKGFDPGPADGMMGPKTRDALKDYQEAEKINQTGRLDAETMAKLGVQASSDAGSPAASPKTGGDAAKQPGDSGKGMSKDPTVPGPSETPKKQNP
ncbi:MAG: peptidoglycan-binding domain-containing protein [Candidatus Rokuibacteriota bacterium]